MVAPLQAVLGNPVLIKELRVRMRGARAFWLLGVYLVILALVLSITYANWYGEAQRGGGFASIAKVGQWFFLTIIWVQTFLVTFITPALTAGAISMEREQRTIDLLQLTPLSRGAIVGGKLAAAYAFIALMVVASLPLTSICFLLGGVSPQQVVQAYAMLLAGCFLMGALGVAWSSVAASTTSAVVLTYASMLVPGFIVMMLIPTVAFQSFGRGAPAWIGTLALPVLQMLGVPWQSFGSASGFLWGAGRFYGLTIPAWVAPVLTYGLGGAILAAIATARMEAERARRVGLLRLLVALALAEQLFFIYGTVFSPIWGSASGAISGMIAGIIGQQPVLGALMYPTIVLMFCIPVFATGDVDARDIGSLGAYLLRGWTRVGWRRGTVASGLPYLLLLVAISLGMYFAGFVAAGKPGAVWTGALARSFASYRPVGSLFGGFPEAVLCIVSMVVGLSLLGVLLSMVTRNRWAALALMCFGTFIIFVGPAVALAIASAANAMGGPGHPAGLVAYAAYLNPLVCLSELSDPAQSAVPQWSGLLGVGVPHWVICPLAYLLLAGLCLLAMAALAISHAARNVAAPVLAVPERRSDGDTGTDA